jgi:hypothetical protein
MSFSLGIGIGSGAGAMGGNHKIVNGHVVDTDTADGSFYAGLWGHNVKDQNQRRQELSYLDRVAGDGFDYNLEDPNQAAAFVADIADGSLDGNIGQVDGSIALTGGTISVGHGKAKYHLANPDDYNRFRQDAADGKLDGNIGGQGPGEVTTKPDVSSSCPKPAPVGESGSGTSGGSGTSSSANTSGGSYPWGHLGAAPNPGGSRTDVNSYSTLELLDMLRNGTLPEEIMRNPAAVAQLQQRIQDYQRMMELITTIMKMQHDLALKIIGNMR